MAKEFLLEKSAHLSSDALSDGVKKEATREGWGRELAKLGGENKNIVALSADLSGSVRTSWFEREFPERFVQVGVAEQNMASVAAGLAMEGKKVFFSSFGVFSPGRNWDQVRVCVAMNRLDVKFSGAHAGISVGEDGATHQALEDIALTRVLPGLVVLNPCDSIEAGKAARAAAETDGPVYIRVGRESSPVFTTAQTPFEIGRAVVLKEGKDVAVLATGILAHEALKAAKLLHDDGIDAAVVNHHTVKPIDVGSVAHYAKKCGCAVTVEEHQITAGFGGAVCEALAENYPAPVVRVGMMDEWGESGPAYPLIEKHGMGAKSIAEAAKKAVGKKKK